MMDYEDLLSTDRLVRAAVRCNDGSWQPQQLAVVQEHSVSLYLDQTLITTLVCTPRRIRELVTGYLCSEGFIRSREDISALELEDQESCARVALSCAKHEKAALTPVMPIAWDRKWIQTFSEHMFRDTPIHQKTNGTHSCFLFEDEKLLFVVEDIGRHNALDKVIGWALEQNVPLSRCIIATSGRTPSDVVRKVIRAGIPILVSKESPTVEGLALAEKYHLTLASMKKDGQQIIWNDPLAANIQ